MYSRYANYNTYEPPRDAETVENYQTVEEYHPGEESENYQTSQNLEETPETPLGNLIDIFA